MCVGAIVKALIERAEVYIQYRTTIEVRKDGLAAHNAQQLPYIIHLLNVAVVEKVVSRKTSYLNMYIYTYVLPLYV